MLIPVLASATGLLAILFIVMLVVAGRRAAQILTLEADLRDQRRTAADATALKEEKARQVDELRTKLDKALDGAKKAKKKAYDHEQASRKTDPSEDEQAARDSEEALLEARAEAKKHRQQAEQAAEQAGRGREEIDRLKAELREAKHTLEQREDELAKARSGQSGQVGELKKKLAKLEGKLKAAERRTRNDAQVYRVTNSKLELALEKITELERQLAKRKQQESAP